MNMLAHVVGDGTLVKVMSVYNPEISRANAIYAILPSAFIGDLARAVSNDGDPDTGADWLIDMTAQYLTSQKLAHTPMNAFDHVVWDIDALDRVWPAFAACEAEYRGQGFLAGCESPLPAIARYLTERLPTMWGKQSWERHTPVTRALVLADNIDTLVGFFGIGIKPTGSKDPFALRRAAMAVLYQTLFPVMRHNQEQAA